MPENNVPQGITFLSNVGSFAMYDNRTNTVAFSGEFATSYAIEITGTTQDTRAGAGNALLMQTHSDRNVAITLTLREWNLEYIAAATGGQISWDAMAEIFQINTPVVVGSDGSVTLDPIPTGPVSVKLPNDTQISTTATAGGVVDLTDYDVAGECVKVTYAYAGQAKVVEISADKTPFIGKLVLDGKLVSSSVGDVGKIEVVIPSFACSDNLTITINADGTTSDTVLTGVALATSGANCLAGMTYGFVKEIRYDDVTFSVAELIVSPDPVPLTVPNTQVLTVMGSPGPMWKPMLLNNSDCTFVSSTPATATVDATGTVTAVGAGETVITVTYNNVSDTVDVTVTA